MHTLFKMPLFPFLSPSASPPLISQAGKSRGSASANGTAAQGGTSWGFSSLFSQDKKGGGGRGHSPAHTL